MHRAHRRRPLSTSRGLHRYEIESTDDDDDDDDEYDIVPITGECGSLERLCSVTVRAIGIMRPLICAIYDELLLGAGGGDGSDPPAASAAVVSKAKEDDSAFTIADGLVQRLLVDVLYSSVPFRDVVGEEDEDGGIRAVAMEDDDGGNGGAPDDDWMRVQGLTVPYDLRSLVESTRMEVQSLADEYLLPPSAPPSSSSSSSGGGRIPYRDITVFIDPIDGTREFSTGMGEQCSVCVGFANSHGRAIAGVVYRPIPSTTSGGGTGRRPTWAAGAISEGFTACDFGRSVGWGTSVSSSSDVVDGCNVGVVVDETMASREGEGRKKIVGGGLLTTNGPISPFVGSLIDILQVERVRSGGAGNKMMMLLERSIYGNNDDRGEGDGGAMLYIQDRGVSRWDTCAAEGVLEAYGGRLTKLTPYLAGGGTTEEGEEKDDENDGGESYYKYLAGPTNRDFVPGLAFLTKNNRRRLTQEDDVQFGDLRAHDVDDVKAYSNLCGFVAVGREWNTVEGRMLIKEAIQRAALLNTPSFN
jgi:3'-phosphoadenosine 5'-phosphosulfate (PAPS) 3'-phosphatase